MGKESGRDFVRQRPLTMVVPVRSAEDVPPGYFRIPVASLAIWSKVQVLSQRYGHPVFVEPPAAGCRRPKAYWAHESTLAALRRWLRYRVFEIHELVELPEADRERLRINESPFS